MSWKYSGAEPDAQVKKLASLQRSGTGEPVEREYRSAGWLRVYKYALPSGAVAGLAFKINDLKTAQAALEQKAMALAEAYQQMRSDALHDALTGLPNRRHLDLYTNGLTERVPDLVGRLHVFHIDLDHFKALNDSLGHAAGDKALEHVGDQLRGLFGPQDFAARAGGDEFTYFRLPEEGATSIEDFAKQISSAIGEPFQFADQTCTVGASVGFAELESADISFRELLANADLHLYQMKALNRRPIATAATTATSA